MLLLRPFYKIRTARFCFNSLYHNVYKSFYFKMVESTDIQNLQDIANYLRIQSLKMTDVSGSGHPTSCASMAELMAALFFSEQGMHYFPKEPRNPANDRFILSKGHASPIYYACWSEAGTFPQEELWNLRKITSDIEGHPTPRLSFCDFATGSLGQGVANAAGCAYASKYFDKNPNKIFTMIGDGESAEGSVWEAINFAGFYKLDNFIAMFDINRLGQSDVTATNHEVNLFADRLTAFKFKVFVIDGHNLKEIIETFAAARSHTGSPIAIVAKTFKGKGFIDIEDKLNWHGKPIKKEDVIAHIEKQLVNKTPVFKVTNPTSGYKWNACAKDQKYKLDVPYKLGEKVSSRTAFGNALKKLGEIDGKDKTIVVGLDADVKNSTFTEYLYKAFPDKFVNCYIAEQLMVSVSQAMSKTNKIPFCATFGTFFTRAADQIRMGAISMDNVKYVGTHSGVHIGEDGPSQMGLEDIALFRAIPNMTVLLPSDGVSAEKAIEIAANHQGSVFIRTERNAHEVIYSSDEVFEIGKLKVVKKSEKDVITIVSYGATLFESLQAAEVLQKEGINVRVIDLFSCKPVDRDGLIENANQTNKLIYVVEDHYPEGGAGEAVMHALSSTGIRIFHKAVSGVPRSGKPHELYELFGLDSKTIAAEVKKLI